jgi:transposase
MRKIRDILRLRLSANLSIRQIRDSTKVSVGGIQKFLSKAEELGIRWPLPDHLTDDQLAQLFYPVAEGRESSSTLEPPDFANIHQEMKRKGVTLQLLWEEYCQRYPTRCYSYSRFCHHYSEWQARQRRSMRQSHKAGEKAFVDYSGSTVPIVCAATGETRLAQIFVGILGASSYTFAEATWSQTIPDWLGSHVRMLGFFGGCPEVIVPDNLRSGVSRACRYDPDINPSYQQWASHYQVAIIPARPRHPKDKAKVEGAVQLVQRWILARLRHRTFFSLAELNLEIARLLVDLNNRPFKQLPGCRREAFEILDKPALRSLPLHPFQIVEIKPARVNIDYHVQFQRHNYSVPHTHVGQRVEIHAGEEILRVFFNQHEIASHPRRRHPGTSTTPGHMPTRHEKHLRWTPGRLKSWAATIGPDVEIWITGQLESKDHPEQAYRICLALLNLSSSYIATRLNNACAIANREGLDRVNQIQNLLKHRKDECTPQTVSPLELPQEHENIRGPQNFQ